MEHSKRPEWKLRVSHAPHGAGFAPPPPLRARRPARAAGVPRRVAAVPCAPGALPPLPALLTLVRICPEVDTLRISFWGPSCSASLSDESSPGPAEAATGVTAAPAPAAAPPAAPGGGCWPPAPAILSDSCGDTAPPGQRGAPRPAAAAIFRPRDRAPPELERPPGSPAGLRPERRARWPADAGPGAQRGPGAEREQRGRAHGVTGVGAASHGPVARAPGVGGGARETAQALRWPRSRLPLLGSRGADGPRAGRGPSLLPAPLGAPRHLLDPGSPRRALGLAG